MFACLFLILPMVVRITEQHMFIYSGMTDLEKEKIEYRTIMCSTVYN